MGTSGREWPPAKSWPCPSCALPPVPRKDFSSGGNPARFAPPVRARLPRRATHRYWPGETNRAARGAKNAKPSEARPRAAAPESGNCADAEDSTRRPQISRSRVPPDGPLSQPTICNIARPPGVESMSRRDLTYCANASYGLSAATPRSACRFRAGYRPT